MDWRAGVLIIGSLMAAACSKPVPPAAAPVAPVAAHDGLRFPGDVQAILEVDAAQLRTSALWYAARRAYEAGSPLIEACPELLGEVQRVSIAYRKHTDYSTRVASPEAVFGILHGVDAAHVRACILRDQKDIAAVMAADAAAQARAGSRPSDELPPECQRYDAEVHELGACEETPLSMRGELGQLARTLAAAKREERAAACSRAADIVERANERRRAVDEFCPVGRDRARMLAKYLPMTGGQAVELPYMGRKQIDERTFSVDRELVYIVDEHTVATVRVMGGGDGARVLQALRTRDNAPRWYEAARQQRRAGPAVWFAADVEDVLGARQADDHAPVRLLGALSLRSDVMLDLELHGARRDTTWIAREQIARQVGAAGASLGGAELRVSCLGAAPSGPREQRCRAARARVYRGMSYLNPTGSKDAINAVLDALETDAAIAACVDNPAYDPYLGCVEAATTDEALARCAEPDDGPMCGARGVAIGIQVPLLTLEAGKLLEPMFRTAIRDCRSQPADSTSFMMTASPPSAELCSDGEDCWTIDLAANATAGHRWRPHSSLDKAACRGPINLGSEQAVGCRTGYSPSLRAVKLGYELCEGTDCARLQPTGEIDQLSTDARHKLAAIVTGRPGAQMIETWDVVAQRRIARFAAGTDRARPCAGVQLLDDALLIQTGACNVANLEAAHGDGVRRGPFASGAGAYLANLQGKRIATLAPNLAIDWPRRLAERRWAFATATGEDVAIYDVATGKIAQRFATGASIAPGHVALATDDAGHVALAFSGDSPRRHDRDRRYRQRRGPHARGVARVPCAVS